MVRLRRLAALSCAGIGVSVALYAALAWFRQLLLLPNPLPIAWDEDLLGNTSGTPVSILHKDYEALLAEKGALIAEATDKLQVLQRLNAMLSASNRSGHITTSENSTQSSNEIHVPNLLDSLSHLRGNLTWLQPLDITTGHRRSQVKLVMGVPHVRRPKESYVTLMLQSLLANLTAEEAASVLIVLQVSEPWDFVYYKNLSADVKRRFPSEVESGMIEIMVPPPQFYPDLDSLPTKWEDSKERTKWRIKQNLDYIFLMTYCASRGTYYVQLEDDVVAIPGYLRMMLSFAHMQGGWTMLEFSSLGFIGKLFRSATVLALVQFIAIFYEQKPCDLLLFSYLGLLECVGEECSNYDQPVRRFKPSLFKHVGYESSLAGKVQPLQENVNGNGDAISGNPVVIRHDNPVAIATTTLKQYEDFSLVGCYMGVHVFWALNPQQNDYVTFTFKEPTAVARYRLLTGDESHPSDKAYDATVQVLPAELNTTHAYQDGITAAAPSGEYVTINKFNTDTLINYAVLSLAEGTVPPEIGKIRSLRIAFHSTSQNWFILKEVHIEIKD